MSHVPGDENDGYMPPSYGANFTYASFLEPRHMPWLRGGFTDFQFIMVAVPTLVPTLIVTLLGLLWRWFFALVPALLFLGLLFGVMLARRVGRGRQYGVTQWKWFKADVRHRYAPKQVIDGRNLSRQRPTAVAVLVTRSERKKVKPDERSA